MLNRFRVGEATEEDIKIIESRPSSLLSDAEYNKASHLCYTNKETNKHNSDMLNKELQEEILEAIMGSVKHPKSYTPKVNEHGLIDKTQFVMELELKKGARVMVISNIDIKDSLVNGSLGVVLDITKEKVTIKDKNGNENVIDQVISVIVVFDDPKAGLQQMERHRKKYHQYHKDRGVPIFRVTQRYQIPHRKNYKEHAATCELTQFPLRLAWALTGHKVQGITIKRPQKVVVHGHPRIPKSMYYLMFSRAQDLEQIYVKNFTGKILANENSLAENKKLVERSIVPSYEENHFCVFMVNIQSLQNKIIELENDIYAPKADHICVVETWLEPNYNGKLEIPNRTFTHASIGRGKGCGMFSLTNRKICEQRKVIRDMYQIMSIVDRTNETSPYQLILVYLSSKCPLTDVVEDLSQILIPQMTTIITGDFNFGKKEINALSTFLKDRNFNQLVTWPTHIQGGTLDHCYVPENVKLDFTRHSPYFSDHSALIIEFQIEDQ